MLNRIKSHAMESVGEILTKSGYSNVMALMGGFRGPRETLFRGTIKEYLFKLHTLFGLGLSHQLVIFIFLTFVLVPDVDLSTMLCLAVPMTTTSFSVVNIYYMELNRPKFIRLLKMNEEASHDEYYNEDLNTEINKWAERANKLQYLLYFVVSAPIVPWGMTPIINEILGSPWGPRKVPVLSWFPYDYQKTPYWIATLFSQTAAGFYATLTNVMFDAVYLCLSFRQLALLVHLKKTFPKIFEVLRMGSKGQVWYTNYKGQAVERSEIDPELTSRLKNWIKHHQTVLGLLKELQSLYSVPLFIHFCYAGTVLASGSAAILIGNLALLELYFVTMHLLGLTFTLFVICRVGDYIKIETYEIVDGLYGQNSFMLSKKQHTLLKNLLTALQKPFEIRIVQAFPLNTETFKSVIATTYSFFAMFTQMQHKK